MGHYFGEVLRTLRDRAGHSLSGLAEQVGYSRTMLSMIENGSRKPSSKLAEALDEYFTTSPYFVLLARRGGEDTVQRRALLTAVGAGIGAGFAMPDAFSTMVLQMLDGDTAVGLDEMVATFERRYLVLREKNLGPELLTQIMILQQRIAEKSTPDLLRAGARLYQLYGAWEGDRGKLAAAHAWYGGAATLAAQSKDRATGAWVQGYAACRGVYEGLSVGEAETAIEKTLAVSRTGTEGSMEAHAARVHLAGLVGDLAGGLRAADTMLSIAGGLPDPGHAATPTARAALFRNFLVGRVGDLTAAEQTHRECAPLLAGVTSWKADGELYWAHALVRHGEVQEGVRTALTAMRQGPGIRMHALGVLDVLEQVPAGHHSAELDELKTYSTAGPGPWQTLRA